MYVDEVYIQYTCIIISARVILHLSNLVISSDAANEARPKPVGNEIGQPESPHGGLVEVIDVQRNIFQSVVWFWILGTGRHERGDDDLGVRKLECHFKLLEELDVLPLELVGSSLEEVANYSHACSIKNGNVLCTSYMYV